MLLPSVDFFRRTETVLKTAAELRYSETLFIRRLSENGSMLNLPVASDLCGRAQSQLFYCLMSAGVISEKIADCLQTIQAISIEVKISLNDDGNGRT